MAIICDIRVRKSEETHWGGWGGYYLSARIVNATGGPDGSLKLMKLSTVDTEALYADLGKALGKATPCCPYGAVPSILAGIFGDPSVMPPTRGLRPSPKYAIGDPVHKGSTLGYVKARRFETDELALGWRYRVEIPGSALTPWWAEGDISAVKVQG